MALILVFLVGPSPASARITGDLDPQLQADLEAAVRAKVSELLAEKDESGISYKRGSYSKSFRKIDDETFQASFHQDTAGKDQVKTERLLLTLKKKGDVDWEVVDEEVMDTFTGLYRSVWGDEEFFTFESFTIEIEGLEVTATNGSIARDYFRGGIAGFVLFADDLKYRYDPPKEALEQYYSVFGYYHKRSRSDFEFDPKHLTVLCDSVTCEDVFASSFAGLAESSLGAVDPRLRSLYNDMGERKREALKANPFAGFQLPPEEDRRYIALSLNKKGDDILLTSIHNDWKLPESGDHNIWLVYDNYEPKEVKFSVTRCMDKDVWYGPILAYYSEETRNSGISPYELEYRPDVNSRDLEVETVTGEIEMALDQAELLTGDIVVGLKAKQDITEAKFRIARERRSEEERKEIRNPTMYVNSIQDADGNELTWVKDSPYSGLVLLPEPIKAGESFTLEMQFQSHGSIRKVNPSFSFVDRMGWLPFVSFADIINEFDLTIHIPDDYKLLGVGKRVSETVEDGVNTTRWVTKQPVMFPSVTFGKYIEMESKVKVTKSDGTEIPIKVHVDKTSTNMLDVDISTANEARQFQEAISSGARGIRGRSMRSIADQAANSIRLYQEVFGVDYPFARLDLVADPVGGLFYGQAPSSLIYLGAFVFRGEGEMAGGTLISGGTRIAKFLKSVVAHEVGHQWWGSSTVNASSNNYWFVESLAEYASAIYLENVYGPEEYQEQVDEWRHNVLERDMTVSVQDASVLSTPDFNYQAAVYNKGPYAFHVLRTTFGDEKLFKFLKMLAQETAGKEIVSRDIQRVAEKAYGVPMEWFFNQWIRGVAIPEFDFEYSTRRTEDGNWLVQGTVKQQIVIGNDREPIPGEYYLGAVPITVTARKSKKEYRVPIRVEGAESQFAFKVPEEPMEVAFNKYNETLSHDVHVPSE
jgi:hypothetical protein